MSANNAGGEVSLLERPAAQKPTGLRQYLKHVGPAAIITMVIMGPGTTADMLRGGAILGDSVGWIVLFSAITS